MAAGNKKGNAGILGGLEDREAVLALISSGPSVKMKNFYAISL